MNDIKLILHTIRPGDTLYNLAMQYGTTVQNIIDTNWSSTIRTNEFSMGTTYYVDSNAFY